MSIKVDIIGGEECVALHVVADIPVAELVPLDSLRGEAGPQGDGAGGRVVRPVSELQPVEPEIAEGPAGQGPQPRGGDTGPRAASVVQYETQPVSWTWFTEVTATDPSATPSRTTAQLYPLPAARSSSRSAIHSEASAVVVTGRAACRAISAGAKARSTAGASSGRQGRSRSPWPVSSSAVSLTRW